MTKPPGSTYSVTTGLDVQAWTGGCAAGGGATGQGAMATSVGCAAGGGTSGQGAMATSVGAGGGGGRSRLFLSINGHQHAIKSATMNVSGPGDRPRKRRKRAHSLVEPSDGCWPTLTIDVPVRLSLERMAEFIAEAILTEALREVKRNSEAPGYDSPLTPLVINQRLSSRRAAVELARERIRDHGVRDAQRLDSVGFVLERLKELFADDS